MMIQYKLIALNFSFKLRNPGYEPRLHCPTLWIVPWSPSAAPIAVKVPIPDIGPSSVNVCNRKCITWLHHNLNCSNC